MTVQNNSNESSSSSVQSSQISSATNASWVRIDKQTFWHNDSYFVDDTYGFVDIAFEYPSQWKFSCCGDMDHGSAHRICSNESYDETSRWCEKAHITILEWGLGGCPSGKWDCGIDQWIPKTAQQKYDDEVNNIRANTGTVILPEMHLPAVGADAFVYAKNDLTRSYLINLGDNVIDVEFSLSEEIDEDFITDFFSRVVWDRS